MTELDRWIQFGILLALLVPFIYGLHLQNQAKGRTIQQTLEKLVVGAARLSRRVKKHDRRTRRTRQSIEEIDERLTELERTNGGSSQGARKP